MKDIRQELWDLVDDDQTITSEASKDEWLQEKHVAFEESCVKRVLNKLNLSHLSPKIRAITNTSCEEKNLTFAGFMALEPTFPIYLGVRNVYKAGEVTTKDFVSKFTTTSIFKAYTEIVEEAKGFDHNGAVGMIYRANALVLILHNNISALDKDGYYQVRTLKKGQTYIIEKLDQFLSNLEWLPSTQ